MPLFMAAIAAANAAAAASAAAAPAAAGSTIAGTAAATAAGQAGANALTSAGQAAPAGGAQGGNLGKILQFLKASNFKAGFGNKDFNAGVNFGEEEETSLESMLRSLRGRSGSVGQGFTPSGVKGFSVGGTAGQGISRFANLLR